MNNYLLVLAGIVMVLCVAAVVLEIAGRIWFWFIDRHTTHPPDTDQQETDGEWVTVASWLEDADGTRRPATPDAVNDFWQQWNIETGETRPD